MKYVDRSDPIEKDMDSRRLLSLGRPQLFDLKSATMTMWSNGPSVEFTAISVNGAPFQFRASPIVVGPDHPAQVYVTLLYPGNTFLPGKNEICFSTPDGQQCVFIVTI